MIKYILFGAFFCSSLASAQRIPTRVLADSFMRPLPEVSRWVCIATTKDDSVFYDQNTIQYNRIGGYTSVWIKYQVRPEARTTVCVRMADQFGDKYYAYYYSKTLMHFDCGSRRYRIVSNVEYNLSEEILESLDRTGAAPWLQIVPESVSEGILEFLCKK